MESSAQSTQSHLLPYHMCMTGGMIVGLCIRSHHTWDLGLPPLLARSKLPQLGAPQLRGAQLWELPVLPQGCEMQLLQYRSPGGTGNPWGWMIAAAMVSQPQGCVTPQGLGAWEIQAASLPVLELPVSHTPRAKRLQQQQSPSPGGFTHTQS